jgi:death-on-curing protein
VTLYLDLETLLAIAERATGATVLVADYGLLDSALGRPQSTVFGQDAYPTLHLKAAALLHSVVGNRGLVDGNKRLGWLATVVFCYINGIGVDAADDDAYNVVIAIADRSLDDSTPSTHGSPRGFALSTRRSNRLRRCEGLQPPPARSAVRREAAIDLGGPSVDPRAPRSDRSRPRNPCCNDVEPVTRTRRACCPVTMRGCWAAGQERYGLVCFDPAK